MKSDRNRHLLAVALALSMALAACRLAPAPPAAEAPTDIPACDDVPRLSAPEEWYRDAPIYVANEQPIEEVRGWAVQQPGFEEVWIDRDHLGWIALAFSQDAEARQAELEELFPDVGAVVVPVDWTMADLHALQRRVQEELAPLFQVGSGILVMQGVVLIELGALREERVAAVEERFAGEPVCISGADPAGLPAPGPQQPAGDGWRLLANEQGIGQPFRTGVATDQPSYERLWREIGLAAELPAVDFMAEVVIWFGAVYGTGCGALRLDDVVVDRERALVHALIVLPDGPRACAGDANPYAYVVAVERARLPTGPFAIQLSEDDPPAGWPEERTVVEVDLTPPGAVAGPDDIHGDPTLPEPYFAESGGIVEPGFPVPYRLNVHCGIEWLGQLNEVAWRAEVPAGSIDFIPPEWQPLVQEGGSIEVSVLLTTDPEPRIEATANDHTVVYRPTPADPPGCD